LAAVTGVSHERWQDAQQAERGFWSTKGFGLTAFRGAVAGSMQTAAWAAPNLEAPPGDWLEVGVGPLGVGCTHFMECEGELHTLDPIGVTPADEWQLPEPCRALIRTCQETTNNHVGQGEQLDFPDESFTLVALENMLDHVEDPSVVLREARRVLVPGGTLVVAIDTFSALAEARFRLLTRRRQRETILVRAHPHRFSSGDVVKLVVGAGFRVTSVDTAGFVKGAVGHCHRTRLLAS
jgi:SAM-dependent methyltransferase